MLATKVRYHVGEGQSNQRDGGCYGEGPHEPQDEADEAQTPHYHLCEGGEDQITLNLREEWYRAFISF